MSWHTVTVTAEDLNQLLLTIRRAGGSITHSFPAATGYTVIYTTLEG